VALISRVGHRIFGGFDSIIFLHGWMQSRPSPMNVGSSYFVPNKYVEQPVPKQSGSGPADTVRSTSHVLIGVSSWSEPVCQATAKNSPFWVRLMRFVPSSMKMMSSNFGPYTAAVHHSKKKKRGRHRGPRGPNDRDTRVVFEKYFAKGVSATFLR